MPSSAAQVYKTEDQIVIDLVTKLQSMISDATVSDDSIFRIWIKLYGSGAAGMYLAQQLLHDDFFIQTASALALNRYGEMYGRPRLTGTVATGSVRFSGAGGVYIPVGTVVSVPRPALGDSLDFETTIDGTVPNPGTAGAPVSAAGVAGNVSGTVEYGITFLTTEGETELGVTSIPLAVTSKQVGLTSIALGGPGTTGRRIYRRTNGGTWGWIADLGNNTVTTYTDNTLTAGAGTPPAVSTAERITLTAQGTDIGTDYNIAVGSITDLSNAPPDLSDVTNLVTFSGGTDEEDIEVFRSKLLKWVRAPQSGSLDDLVNWAEAIDGVESATAFANVDLSGTADPGTVSIRITGPGGSTPSAAVIAAVLAEVVSHDLGNITVLVGTFTPHAISVAVAITEVSGYTLGDVTPSVTQAITDYLADVPVGGTVYKSGILAAIFPLPGVANVTTTFTDTALAATEKAVAGTITVS